LPLAVSGPIDWLPPEGGTLSPDQPPEAVQEAALVEDQVSVEDPLYATDVGFAVSDTVGSGGNTVTVTVALALPPEAELQVRE
jgi:hypothetical protein